MRTRVKAVTYQGIKDIVVKEMHDPKIEKRDDIIVRVTSTAICGRVETVDFTAVEDPDLYLKEITHGGADVVLDCHNRR